MSKRKLNSHHFKTFHPKTNRCPRKLKKELKSRGKWNNLNPEDYTFVSGKPIGFMYQELEKAKAQIIKEQEYWFSKTHDLVMKKINQMTIERKTYNGE